MQVVSNHYGILWWDGYTLMTDVQYTLVFFMSSKFWTLTLITEIMLTLFCSTIQLSFLGDRIFIEMLRKNELLQKLTKHQAKLHGFSWKEGGGDIWAKEVKIMKGKSVETTEPSSWELMNSRPMAVETL